MVVERLPTGFPRNEWMTVEDAAFTEMACNQPPPDDPTPASSNNFAPIKDASYFVITKSFLPEALTPTNPSGILISNKAPHALAAPPPSP